jgi:hypothetical protein
MAGWASRNKYSLLARHARPRPADQLRAAAAAVGRAGRARVAGTLSTHRASSPRRGPGPAASGPTWHVFTPWGFAGFLPLHDRGRWRSPTARRSTCPKAESELIAGHLTEYSGFKYALFFMAEYFGMFAVSGDGRDLLPRRLARAARLPRPWFPPTSGSAVKLLAAAHLRVHLGPRHLPAAAHRSTDPASPGSSSCRWR